MQEELKLILELFSKVTDGALIGGMSYLVLNFLSSLIPWGVGAWLGSKLIDKVPRITVEKKREE